MAETAHGTPTIDAPGAEGALPGTPKFSAGPDEAARTAPSRQPGGPARVSVIVPARNADKFIEETFESLLAQTDPSWQAIIINDKSTDRTQEIIDSYIARYPGKFVCYQGPGIGVSSARNLGLDKAQGERIMFLDSDDWIDPDWLELMNAALDNSPGAVAAYCGCYRVMKDGRKHLMFLDREIADDPFRAMARSCAVSIHTVLLDRKELDIVGRFDTSLVTTEDWDLWQRFSRRGGRWVLVDKYISYYRTGHSSLSQRVDSIMEQGELVLRRGFAADPRVPDPDPKNANGTSENVPNEFVNRIGALSMYCLSSYIGTFSNLDGAAKLVRPIPEERSSGVWLPDVFIEGYAQGAGIAAENLAQYWPSVGPHLDMLLKLINEQWRDNAAIQKVRQRTVDFVAEKFQGPGTTMLEGKFLAGVDLRNLPRIEAPQGIDRVVVKFLDGDTFLGEASFGIRGAIEPHEWMRLALCAVSHDELHERFPVAAEAVLAEQRQRLRASSEADAQPHLDDRSADRELWEKFFSTGADPFKYDSPYERQKFENSLEMVGDRPDARVLELACAEGHFTQRLAGKVGQVIATDVAEAALVRARERCREMGNVEFRQLDMTSDPLPEGLDVIYCSEVLYYLADLEAIVALARKAAAALKPGGHWIMTHAFMIQDDRSKTGFDWAAPFGADTFAKVFADTPGFALERSDQTELYRTDRFVKLAEGESAPEPIINRIELTAFPVGPAARDIYWGGTKVARSDADKETRAFLPVLMYHAVDTDGPKALDRYRVTPDQFREQMRWLKQNGFYSITSADLAQNLASEERFSGRPVVITFDDGMQNFSDNAWPILKEFGFTAEMFLVTDLLGRDSRWDASYGQTYPLMSPETIKALAAEGVVFGSHLATHPKADQLTTEALYDEMVRSRDAMTALLGKPPVSLAAPYGLIDMRFVDLAWRAGYTIAYSCDDRVAYVTELPLLMPRLEMNGAWTQKQFIAALETCLIKDFPQIESDDLLSVVVTARNAALTIDANLNALRNQTHKNLEIIVVDDGSTDTTRAIVERHATLDRRVRLVALPRSGTAAALNAGWRASLGKAVAFMVAKDLAYPDKLRRLYSALLGSGDEVGLAYNWSERIDASGWAVGIVPESFKYGDVLGDLIAVNVLGNPSSAMVRREVLESLGGFDESLYAAGAEGCEDLAFYLKVAEQYQFALIPEHLTGDRLALKANNQLEMMRSWLTVTLPVLQRHPEFTPQWRRGLRRYARLYADQAMVAWAFGDIPKLMALVAPHDLVIAAKLPLRCGKWIAGRIRRRVARYGGLATIKSIFRQLKARA